jgi:hypothetical protein
MYTVLEEIGACLPVEMSSYGSVRGVGKQQHYLHQPPAETRPPRGALEY